MLRMNLVDYEDSITYLTLICISRTYLINDLSIRINTTLVTWMITWPGWCICVQWWSPTGLTMYHSVFAIAFMVSGTCTVICHLAHKTCPNDAILGNTYSCIFIGWTLKLKMKSMTPIFSLTDHDLLPNEHFMQIRCFYLVVYSYTSLFRRFSWGSSHNHDNRALQLLCCTCSILY